jgi:hypothetical protein
MIIKDAIKDMESMMNPKIVKKVNRIVKINLFFIKLDNWIKNTFNGPVLK